LCIGLTGLYANVHDKDVVMPDISLTDFVDFAISTPPSQLTKVRQLCNRGPYDPRFDFWKALRERVQEFHEKGKKLDGVLVGLTDAKKVKRYPSYCGTNAQTYEKRSKRSSIPAK